MISNVADRATHELHASEIRWLLPVATSPWPNSAPVLDVALEALPIVEDSFAAEVIEAMAHTIIDLRVELRAVREVLSETLTLTSAQTGQAANARRRLAERMREERCSR